MHHPYDTPLSAGLRFLVEVIAWVAGPWAAARLTLWLALPTAIILVGTPAIFSAKGDKKQVLVPTPGPVRVAIELLLHAVAVAGPWIVWPAPFALLATLVVAAALITGLPRLRWLLRGAPDADREFRIGLAAPGTPAPSPTG
jgi:hypothetical protein